MKTIDFVVRNDAGAIQRGVVPADGLETVVTLSGGLKVSFNLDPADISQHQRDGDDLVLTLADGRVVRLENYFEVSDAPNQLYLSTNGALNDVLYVQSADGDLIVQYGPTEQWGKWSPADDLIFLGRTEVAAVDAAATEEVSMLAPLLLAGGAGSAVVAAGVAGYAVTSDLLGLNGGGVPSAPAPVRVSPAVNDADASIDVGDEDADAGLVAVTGTGTPGEAVTVTIGDEVEETTIAPDGTWGVSFVDETLPEDGTHETAVVVTDGGDNTDTLVGPVFVIDTTPPDVSVASGTSSVGDAFNADAFAQGVSITGTGEAGAEVTVALAGSSQTTTIGADGTWAVGWAAGALAEGEYTESVTVTAVDAFGNSTTLSDAIVVDTVASATLDGSVEGDGTINADEAAGGVTFTGSADPGSSVVVTFATSSQTVTAGDDGRWSARFTSSDVPAGESEVTVTATATDPLGNSASATSTVRVDTLVNALGFTSEAGGSDGVINAVETTAGLMVTGIAEPGATITLSLGAATASATADADGNWSASFPASDIASGTYQATLSATAIDLAGNSRTITQSVTVDTEASHLIIEGPIAGDDIINGSEAADGVMLSGSAEPGAIVSVTMAGVSHEVITQASGTWQAFFSAGEVAPGVYTADITATTTDAAGNSATASDTVQVDTRVEMLTMADDAGPDGVVNADEHSDGITLSGQVEPGSSITVTFQGSAYEGVVDASGNWSLVIPAADVDIGQYTAEISVTATDAAGNMESLASTLQIDTFAPEGPVIESFTRDTDGIRGISTAQSDGDLSVARVDGTTIEEVAAVQTDIDAIGETNFAFSPEVPDGSQLIVTATDAAGNTRGTYVVLDDESAGSTVDLGTPGLGNYNVEAVDLQFAEEANLTITEAQLVALSSNADSLIVHGGADDQVTLDGSTAGGATTIDGQVYDIYTLGAGTVIIDEDIQIGGVV